MNRCHLCSGDFFAPSFKLLLFHINRVHSNSPDFNLPCGIDNCQITFTNFHAFKRHIRKKHRSYLNDIETDDGDGDADSLGDQQYADVHCDAAITTFDTDDEVSLERSTNSEADLEISTTELARKRAVALWILKLKEGRKLTQSATEEILQDVTEFCGGMIANMKSNIYKLLSSAGINADDVSGLEDLFQDESPYVKPFSKLETQYLQMSYYKKHLGFVEPIQICLGTHQASERSSCGLKEVKDTFVYIPLLEVIERLLKCPVVYEEIMRGHVRTDEIMEDYCDSPKAKQHPLFGKLRNALQIILYFDEVELCNPLGAFRKKHKLGCYYYTIGNISPMFRSSLKAIFILCLVENPILNQYGHDKVLKPAVDDLSKLEKGVTFDTCEGRAEFFGTIASVCGDNPGSAAVAGFKESSSAFRCCRQCLATKEQMVTKFHEKYFILRNPTSHSHHCELLQDPNLSEHYSITYGINRDSILNKLEYFHVSDETMPPDLLHDMLEGYLPYKTKLMLCHFFKERLLSVEDINDIMESFLFGSVESTDIPSPLLQATFQSTDSPRLGQNASQMWTLGRLLPVMIGHLVPEDNVHWLHYLEVLDIMDLLFSPLVHPETPGYLEVLLEQNLEAFRRLYPDHSILPKMHFLVHTPHFLTSVGPLVRHWTMRFEAKHQYIKTLASRMGNYINICYSLAVRQLSYQCYILSSESGVCVTQQVIGRGKTTKVHSTIFKDHLVTFNLTEDDTIYCPKHAEVQGLKLKPGNAVITSVKDPTDLHFARIEELFVVNSNIVLGLITLNVVEYCNHYHSWIVEVSPVLLALQIKDIQSRQVLTLRPVRGSFWKQFYITLKYAV